jgi:hypothetical protein
MFTVVHNKELGTEDARVYKVCLTGLEKVSCNCGLFEHARMPCRHSLKVNLETFNLFILECA